LDILARVTRPLVIERDSRSDGGSYHYSIWEAKNTAAKNQQNKRCNMCDGGPPSLAPSSLLNHSVVRASSCNLVILQSCHLVILQSCHLVWSFDNVIASSIRPTIENICACAHYPEIFIHFVRTMIFWLHPLVENLKIIF
jgi:hypothetical protein